MVTSVRLIAARHVLGLLTSDEIVHAADGLLAGGVYSHQLGEFATIREPIYSEVGPLFTAALKELQVPVPSREEAARTVAWYCLAGVAEGAVEPRDGLDRFMAELYQPLQFEEAELLNSCGGSELAGWASEYEYLQVLAEEPYLDAGGAAVPGRAALDRQAVEFAVRWTRRHCPVRVDPAWLAWAGGTVTSLARSILQGRCFENLPILADALEDAGCDDEEILQHCRVPGRHLNDCWLLDAILHGG